VRKFLSALSFFHLIHMLRLDDTIIKLGCIQVIAHNKLLLQVIHFDKASAETSRQIAINFASSKEFVGELRLRQLANRRKKQHSLGFLGVKSV